MLVLILSVSCTKQSDKQKKSTELSSIIEMLMQNNNDKALDWEMKSVTDNLPVTWGAEGLTDTEDGLARNGVIRVSVNKKEFWVLKDIKQPDLWDLSIRGSKFGITKAELGPHGDCFGVGNSGCDFQFDNIFKNKTKISTLEVCVSRIMSDHYSLYKLSAVGKKDAYLLYASTSGSGGESNSIELWWTNDDMPNTETACNVLEETYPSLSSD